MPKQIVYKYRSLEPWEFFLDILVYERLYAANYKSLNDPMEGVYTYSSNENSSFIKQMSEQKMQLKICSLSKVRNSMVMWSYYSSSHRGVVFELDIDTDGNAIDSIKEVDYVPTNEFQGFLGSDAFTEAKKILSKKNSTWSHEKEIRVFSQEEFVPVSLRKIYLGCLMPDGQRKLVKTLVQKLNRDVEVIQIKSGDLDASF